MAETSDNPTPIPAQGIVLRAKNGDVIRYDPSGLVMRLSDRVIADIALRLPDQGSVAPDTDTNTGTDTGTDAKTSTPASDPLLAPADLPEGVDGWNARQMGDWLLFDGRLPGRQGVRAFRKHTGGGDIIADPAGPILGLLGLGGARAALANPGPPAFPHHIVAPADDIGAVGHAGIETASEQPHLEHLREMTHEALAAQTILEWRMEDFGPLPLFVTRVETDASATAADLATGRAIENLAIAARNLRLAAETMGKRAKVLAVTLDFALEDHSQTATAYRDGMLAVMEAVSRRLWDLGFDRPLFVARFENGLPDCAPQAALSGQWELSWNHGDHRLIHSAPCYMFALDPYDRLTEPARIETAEMTALAIAAGTDWKCPTLHLAELEGGERTTLRVTARAMGPLLIDSDDPLGAGAGAGFALLGCDNGATITGVAIDPEDPQAVLLTLDKAPTGADLRLGYACTPPGGPRATGALRDEWRYTSATGRELYRFALPALLPITWGRG